MARAREREKEREKERQTQREKEREEGRERERDPAREREKERERWNCQSPRFRNTYSLVPAISQSIAEGTPTPFPSEKGDNLKGFVDFYRQAKARI